MNVGTPVVNEHGVIGIVCSPTVVNGTVFVMFVGGGCEDIYKVDKLTPVSIGIVPTA